MENLKKYLTIAAVSFVLGGFIVYNITGPESKEQTQINETNKEKEKTENDVITVIEEDVKPDGTKTKKTTVIDKTKKEKESESTKETNHVKIFENTKDWIAGLTASKNFKDLSEKEVYGIMVGKKIISTKKIDIYGVVEYKTNGVGSAGVLGTF